MSPYLSTNNSINTRILERDAIALPIQHPHTSQPLRLQRPSHLLMRLHSHNLELLLPRRERLSELACACGKIQDLGILLATDVQLRKEKLHDRR